jgi:hypothetical protein
MNQKRVKSWKYYLFLFLLSFVALGGIALYKYFAGTFVVGDLWNALVLPVVLALVMFLSDVLVQKFASKKNKTNYEGIYLDGIAEQMRRSNKFLIEDFRRLKESARFQEALKYGFYIVQHGESEHFTLAHLEKRFDSRGLEGKAVPFIVGYVREKLAEKQQ